MKSFTLALITLSLAACGRIPTAAPVDVPAPVVITAVVTATGQPPQPTPASGTTAATAQPAPTETPAYPPPFHASLTAVYEEFEHGFMLYLSDRKTIWVCYNWINTATGTAVPTENFGTWSGYPDIFQDGQPETDPNIVPPANFQQPKRGFGQVWRDNQNVRDALGWALDWERPYTANVVDFSIGSFNDKGVYSPASFLHTVTTDKGTTIYINEVSGTWSRK